MYTLNVGQTFNSSEKLTREVVAIDLSRRTWKFTYVRTIFVEENDREHMLSKQKTSFKNYKNIPEHVLPYYKGIRPEQNPNGSHSFYLDIEKPAEKFEISNFDAFKFVRYLAYKMPENVEDLSPDIVGRFLNVIDKEKGYDMSILFIVATESRKVTDMFGGHLEATNYIVMDHFMNPIDVKEFYKVMNRIIVKK